MKADLDAIEAVASGLANVEGAGSGLEDILAAVNEARAGRVLDADVRQIRAKVKTLLDGEVVRGQVAQALRGIHTDLDIAVAAYAEATS